MKKPKDVTDLANRLASAASAPLVPPPAPAVPAQAAPIVTASAEPPEARPARAGKPRRPPKRSSVSLFLRISPELYERYDSEAVRRTKETGRGVTVQQVIIARLAEANA